MKNLSEVHRLLKERIISTRVTISEKAKFLTVSLATFHNNKQGL